MSVRRSTGLIGIFVSLICLCIESVRPVQAQTRLDTVFTIEGIRDSVLVYIPTGYNATRPPALFVWWHQVIGTRREMLPQYSDFATQCNMRGWILLAADGPNDRHWNARLAQEHEKTILDWLSARLPFSHDSIYFCGSSMGGAAAQVWHYNNCGPDDYMIAAAAGTSGILDCERRQWEYLRLVPSDTNRSMRAAFGGIPCDQDSCDTAEFEYHRYSALYITDTTKSFHFNGMHLPVYQRWGAQDDERERYGIIAESLAVMRQDFPAPTDLHESDLGGHGYINFHEDSVLAWFAQFSVNREPDTLSLAADENDDYYWTHVSLPRAYTFGRFGVARDVVDRRLDINLVRNVDTIQVDVTRFEFMLVETLHAVWTQRDDAITGTVVALHPIDYFVVGVHTPSEPQPNFQLDLDARTLYVTLNQDSLYTVYLGEVAVDEQHDGVLPRTPQLVNAYPNPFNATSTLVFESPREYHTTLEIYTLLGELARTTPVTLKPGQTRISFNSAELGSGIYFAKLSGSREAPLKITLLK